MEVQVNSVTVAEYVYDGDGNQVKAIVTGGDLTIDTIFIGTYYQQTTTLDESVSPAVETTEWEKYYYAGATRLAIPLRRASGTSCAKTLMICCT